MRYLALLVGRVYWQILSSIYDQMYWGVLEEYGGGPVAEPGIKNHGFPLGSGIKGVVWLSVVKFIDWLWIGFILWEVCIDAIELDGFVLEGLRIFYGEFAALPLGRWGLREYKSFSLHLGGWYLENPLLIVSRFGIDLWLRELHRLRFLTIDLMHRSRWCWCPWL